MEKKWNIGWGTVSNCNMRCAFCYSRQCRKPIADLLIDDWIRFIDDNWNHINSINYGTGENSLCDDWFVLIKYVRDKYPNIRQAVTTNGYISEVVKNDPVKNAIVMGAIDEMDISLDYADPEKHNDFRGQKKAHYWAISALEYCRSCGIKSTLVCLGSSLNLTTDNLDGIFAIAQKYGAIVRINLYRPTEGIDDFSSRFILSPHDLVDILRWISKNHTVLSISDALLSSLLTNNYEPDPSGYDSLRILPNGDITPSTYLIHDEFIVGNIKDKDILMRLSDNSALKNIIRNVIPEECKGCIYAETCKGGVLDRRYLWNESLEKKDPYCIYEPGDPAWEKISVSEQPFESVHHGYLPTMFFAPGKGD